MLSPELPAQINAAAMRWMTALLDNGQRLGLLGDDWDHAHISHTAGRRLTEETELLHCEVSLRLTVCPSWKCGEPADGGIESWSRWRQDRNLPALDRVGGRSDEEVAAAAIAALLPLAHIERLPEDGQKRTPDLSVALPDGREAVVEVTMHTDRHRRELLRAKNRFACSTLRNEWHVLAFDNRFLEEYANSNSFQVNSVQRTLCDVLARAEAESANLDDFDCINESCEAEVAREWKWKRGLHLEAEPPLSIQIIAREPVEAGNGGIRLSIAPCTFNFRNVIDVSDLITAVQESIDRKIARHQWGDTTSEKWLVIVLDGGGPSDQLLCAFEFDEQQPDLSGIEFPGIDEVWAVAFDAGSLTVLRFTGSGARWQRHPELPIPTVQ